MSWAKVKKINSDMSKPLNELFLDSMYLYATDDSVIVNVASNVSLGKNDGEVKLGQDYICQLNGSLKINCEITDVTKGTVGVSVRIAGNEVVLLYVNEDVAYKSQVIEVKKGDVISFYGYYHNLNSSPAYGSVDSININGQVGFAPKGEIFKIM